MKIRIICLVMGTLANSGPAFAGCSNAGSFLSDTQITTILSGNYACGKSTATNPPGWNERHVGTSVVEQHEGGATVETVGTWSVSPSSLPSRGKVTYSYTGGTTAAYEVAALGTSCPTSTCTTLPQTYQFCGVGGAPAVLNIYVSTTFQAPSSPGVMNTNCPSNP